MALLVNPSKSSGFLQRSGRGGHSRTATNARLLARAGYWMMTPHKIPARIAFIRQLTSKNEQLLALNAERAAKIDELSKRSDLDRPLAFMHIPKTSGMALRAGLREILPSTACIEGADHSAFGTFRSFETMSPQLRQSIYENSPSRKRHRPCYGPHGVFHPYSRSACSSFHDGSAGTTFAHSLTVDVLAVDLDEDLLPMGALGRVVRLSRQPLVEFLNHPEVAFVTDNIAVRMLLWPHPLIPDHGFIDSASDERLASEAAARLKTFDFADVIENPRLEDNVRAFLARPFVYRRLGENLVRSDLSVPLEEELTGEALLLVEHHSRLDRELWRAVAAERIAGADLTALSDDTFRRTVTRYAAQPATGR